MNLALSSIAVDECRSMISLFFVRHTEQCDEASQRMKFKDQPSRGVPLQQHSAQETGELTNGPGWIKLTLFNYGWRGIYGDKCTHANHDSVILIIPANRCEMIIFFSLKTSSPMLLLFTGN